MTPNLLPMYNMTIALFDARYQWTPVPYNFTILTIPAVHAIAPLNWSLDTNHVNDTMVIYGEYFHQNITMIFDEQAIAAVSVINDTVAAAYIPNNITVTEGKIITLSYLC